MNQSSYTEKTLLAPVFNRLMVPHYQPSGLCRHFRQMMAPPHGNDVLLSKIFSASLDEGVLVWSQQLGPNNIISFAGLLKKYVKN